MLTSLKSLVEKVGAALLVVFIFTILFFAFKTSLLVFAIVLICAITSITAYVYAERRRKEYEKALSDLVKSLRESRKSSR